MNIGKSIRLFLANGHASGVIVAEIPNWTGHLIVAPRNMLPDLLRREESARTGVYFLIGENPENPYLPTLYIGESDNIGKRLRDHDSKKDFWEKVCIITSKDSNLTKGHAKYLESALILLAKDNGRAELENHQQAEYIQLPEADRADMDYFLTQLKIILPALGFNFLKESTRRSTLTQAQTLPRFILKAKGDIVAHAEERDGDFVVLKGSHCREEWIGVKGGYQKLFEQLEEEAIIAKEPSGNRIFTRDYAFNSPSASAAVVLGRSANGRQEWKTPSGQTYAEWQDAQLNEIPNDELHHE
ncbi:GIY-YIG nuclease family protein [Cardiobacteriaceae bacterium TAE3-ERU3]|nr:GIY-YIG nuclease family protein [Cardiobacteriaceae bacterium TAE3-ERU3]